MWAHIGWLMFKLNPEPPMDNVNDLRKDKLVMWQYKYVHWIGLVVGLVIPSAARIRMELISTAWTRGPVRSVVS